MTKRKRDIALAKEMSGKPCLVCGIEYSVVGHHLKSFKSSGLCNYDNVVPVCYIHHDDFHKKGTTYMADTYPSVLEHLTTHNWEYCKLTNRWFLILGRMCV